MHHSINRGIPTTPLEMDLAKEKEFTPTTEQQPPTTPRQDLLPNEQKVNDIFFTILYVTCFIGFVTACVYYSIIFNRTTVPQPQVEPIINVKLFMTVVPCCLGLVAAASILFLICTLNYTKETIYASLAFVLSLLTFGLISSIYKANIAGSVVGAVMLLLFVAYFFAIRKRIPFTVSLVKSTRHVIGERRGIFVVVLGGVVCTLAYSSAVGWLVHVVTEIPIKHNTAIPLYVFVAFFSYWTMNLILSLCHTIVSGVFATYYLVDKLGIRTSTPVLDSTRRTIWYSFGSVAFGSLIVAFIQTIRMLLNSARQRNDGRRESVGSALGSMLALFADCLLSIMERVVRVFNYYAYIMISITGKSFITSAKVALKLFKERGMTVLINDNIISQVILLGIVLSNGFAQLVTFLCFGMWKFDEEFLIAYTVFTIVVGLVLSSFLLSTLQSGTCTALVCYSIDPECLTSNESHCQMKTVIDGKLGVGSV